MALPLLALLSEDVVRGGGEKCFFFHSFPSPGLILSSRLGKGPACPSHPEEDVEVMPLAAAGCGPAWIKVPGECSAG